MKKIFDPILQAKADSILRFIGPVGYWRILDGDFYRQVKSDFGANKTDVETILVHLHDVGKIAIKSGPAIRLERVA